MEMVDLKESRLGPQQLKRTEKKKSPAKTKWEGGQTLLESIHGLRKKLGGEGASLRPQHKKLAGRNP